MSDAVESPADADDRARRRLHPVDDQQGDVIVHGQATAASGLKIGLNFVVPFIVLNLGVLAGTRTAKT